MSYLKIQNIDTDKKTLVSELTVEEAALIIGGDDWWRKAPPPSPTSSTNPIKSTNVIGDTLKLK